MQGENDLSVKELVAQVRENERILLRYQNLELQLLSSRTARELLDTLLRDTRDLLDLDAVELWLYDPQSSLQVLLQTDDWPEVSLLANSQPFQQLFTEPQVSLLARERINQLALFGGQDISTAAILPIARHEELIGSLHLGSMSQRYSADMSTDFLAHLASIIAVCIENALNQERLRRLSLVDVLTQVKNRRGFDADLHEELQRVDRSKEPLSLLFIDIDHFKQVNDQYGHVSGDRALRLVAGRITELVRGTDHVCRYGGEEFAVLLPNCDANLAREIAERIRHDVACIEVPDDNEKSFRVTLSIGLCCLPGDTTIESNAEQLSKQFLSAADNALYVAKTQGRNRTEEAHI